MKDLLKKAAIAGSALTLMAGTAFAAVGNSGTGENSLNKVNLTGENKSSVMTNNHASLRNDLDVNANSGENKINGSGHYTRGEGGNAGDQTIGTGDADASATVSNMVNKTTVDATMPSSMMSGDLGNMNTGKNSENYVEAKDNNRLNIVTNNNAIVNNDVDVTANTGRNTINASGRGDATITTGDASASATVTNEVNTTSVSAS